MGIIEDPETSSIHTQWGQCINLLAFKAFYPLRVGYIHVSMNKTRREREPLSPF